LAFGPFSYTTNPIQQAALRKIQGQGQDVFCP
jgi:hypothetical protein